MNVVEQQLLSALRETPFETDCSVSVRVLETLGYASTAQQEQWLSQQRGPRDGKRWYCNGERWEYCAAAPDEAVIVRMPKGLTAGMRPARQVTQSAIVVKPLKPLSRG